MAKVFLGFGSNSGERQQRLEHAVQRLATFIVPRSLRCSSVYVTPALLPNDAPAEWNRPFLNLVAEIDFAGTPAELLAITQKLELEAGRVRELRWSPRTLDIDILFWQGLNSSESHLTLPHPEIKNRAFVLDPLAELAPHLVLPGTNKSVLELSRSHPQHTPRLMGIFNLTPDSFSDGNKYNSWAAVEKTLAAWDESQVAIVDIGAESTRPGAQALSADDEWTRLQPIVDGLRRRYGGRILRPKISVDTRRAEVATKAIEYGVDIINDVSGVADLKMMAVLRSSKVDVIAMHSLTIPADPQVHLPVHEAASTQLHLWFTEKISTLEQAGVVKSRLWLDPGIGFGKTSIQSIELLKSISKFYDFGLPIVAGHSRKSFQKDFTPAAAADRDPETLGASIALVEKGVDVLRVHDPVVHRRALLSRSHLL